MELISADQIQAGYKDFLTTMNYNDAKSNNFAIQIANAPAVVHFTQEVSIPSITQGFGVQETPMSIMIKHAGDKVEYEELTFTMAVDENLRVYEDMLNWFKDTQPQIDCDPSRKRVTSESSGKQTIIIYVLSNNANPIGYFEFDGCFPLRVGNLEYDHSNPIDKMKFTTSFSVDMFDFKRMPKNA